MKQVKKVTKKIGSLLLAAAMIITSFPALGSDVHAEENGLPDKTQFATVDELKSFNTDDTNDGTKNPAKVYFGQDNQQWWIAGSQNEEGLTLFAAIPLATGQQFEPSTSSKGYDAQWNCQYPEGVPSDVNANHYGGSPLRKKLRELEQSNFSSSEQNLMNNTTIYTNDTKNSKNYSTTEKLYLPYGDYNDNQYVTVGKNASDSLNNGLHIDKAYWGDSIYWLRAPALNHGNLALVASPGYSVYDHYVSNAHALVPAFELNLSSVLFASAAPAASSDGNLTLADTDGDGAFTLRYSGKDLGSALVSYDKSQVTLTKVPSDTYLVVQNSEGAWAKKITNETIVTPNEVNASLTSFENCKVWLETTDIANRMTYATLATEEQGYDVNVVASNGLTVTNGTQGVAQGSPIADIKVEVEDGYYLPDGYTDSIQDLNGLSVEDITQHGFTISGTPTSDVNITLPEARKEAFSITGGTRGIDYTYENHILTILKDGEYKIEGDGKVTEDRIIVDVGLNTKITISNLNIDASNTSGGAFFIKERNGHSGFAAKANTEIILEGSNVLKSSAAWAAITYNNGEPNKNSFLTITGEGSLYAKGGRYASDIGISNGQQKNNIIIKNGNITVAGEGIKAYLKIDGGSIKGKIPDDVLKDATNSEGKKISSFVLENPNKLSNLKIDDKEYKRFGNHDGDDNFYLYLTCENHDLKFGKENKQIFWSSNDNKFILKDYSPKPQNIETKEVTKDKIVLKDIENSTVYGDVEYSIDGTNYSDSNIFDNLNSNTKYTVYARYKGNNSYSVSEPITLEVTTLKDGNNLIVIPTDLKGVYGQKLFNVKLSGNWKWVDENTSFYG